MKRVLLGVQPGDLLSYVIREVTGQTATSCGACRECVKEMNANGWWWCWRNRKTIAHRLVIRARELGHQISDDRAVTLVVAAFKMFWKFRQTEVNTNMKTFNIRKVSIVSEPQSVKDVLARMNEARLVSIFVTEQMSQKLPLIETGIVEAGSLEEAFAKIDQAEMTSITVGQPGPAPIRLPPPLPAQDKM